MKKVLSVLAVLALAGVSAFAADPKKFYLTTTKEVKSGFGFNSKALTGYDANQTFDLDDQSKAITEGTTSATTVGYAAYFTNSKTLVDITLGATDFKSTTVTTTIPYTFTVGTDLTKSYNSSETATVQVFKETDAASGNRYGSAEIKVTVPQESWDHASAATDYKATLTLTATAI